VGVSSDNQRLANTTYIDNSQCVIFRKKYSHYLMGVARIKLLPRSAADAIVPTMIVDMIHTLLDAGLSQAEIARRTGLPQPNINRLIHGRQETVYYQYGKALEREVAALHRKRK
jgi:hypothetical protein